MDPIRILIVEDEGIVATDIEWQVQNLGYTPVGIAVTGEEAIALAERHRPSLVLMDIRLAGEMDGVEAATLIRKKFDIPSIFLTAYATDDIVERAKQAAPLGYLIKPFEERSLRTTIEIALHKQRLDERLRASEERYRTVMTSAHDAIVVLNEAGQIVSWNPKAADLFGYTESEVLGQPFTLLAPPHLHAQYLADVKSAFKGEFASAQQLAEVAVLRKDGSEFPVESSIAVWGTREGRFATAIIRDISERKRAEALIHLQSSALEAAANAIVITDRDGTIVWVNRAFSQLTGYSLDEAVGHNPRDLVKSGVHERAFYEQLWKTITGGQVWFGELTNRRKDGSHYVEEQTITPVLDGEGRIANFVAIKRDLTDEKQRAAAFLQAQKMEVVGRLVGGVVHDFNNMLTVINGTSGLLLSDLPGDDPLRADLQQIKDAGDRAASMTRQLLAFSRKQVVSPTVLSVSAQVSGAAKTLQRLIGEDITLTITAGDDLDHVRIDPGQFEQVLMNLVVNARDAMPHGGTLAIETRTVTLDAADALQATVEAGPYVRLSVTDTGTGMPPEVLERLFEPFFTTKERGKGTGLGLATVADIVRQGGGRITVTSAPGAGSTFNVDLPRVAGQVAAGGETAALARGTETVLVVEDDAPLRLLTERMLQKAGYTVLSSPGGEQALALLEGHQGPVDLLLTDVVMPGIGGVALAARLATLRPGIKVLFMSGYTDDRLGPEVLGGDGVFIAKPFTPQGLTAQVRRVLDAPAPVVGADPGKPA